MFTEVLAQIVAVIHAIPPTWRRSDLCDACRLETWIKGAEATLGEIRHFLVSSVGEDSVLVAKIDRLMPRAERKKNQTAEEGGNNAR